MSDDKTLSERPVPMTATEIRNRQRIQELESTLASRDAEIARLREALRDITEQADDVIRCVGPGVPFDKVKTLLDSLKVFIRIARTALNGGKSNPKPKSGVRVCPMRDAVCPHGLDCPHSINRYECTPAGLGRRS